MKRLKKVTKFFISLMIFFIISICGVYFTCYLLGPPELESDHVTTLYDKHENEFKISYKSHSEATLDDIAPYLIDAVILIEDKNFYDHHGFDLFGIGRAIKKNVASRRLKEGASTITQQLARNLYLSHEKTWKRKVKEAFYTIRLEMFYTKDDILTSYLNSIYYGHGAYGIESASKLFFNKRAKDLTIAESAMLAGIPKGPTYYSPFNDEERALERQQLILKTMVKEKAITIAAYYQAKAEQLHFQEMNEENQLNNHFEDYVFREASKLLQQDIPSVINGGYKIYTTLDSSLQKTLEDTISDTISPTSEIEIGALAINPENGAILSLVGGNTHRQSSFNRAVNAKRMVGSAFKPFLYYAALNNGYTATTMLLSEPTTFQLDEHTVYAPKNFNSYYAHKPITLAEAIAVSDNIYAVKTNLFLNPETVIQTTKQFGITSDLPNVPSLALGTASITVNEMVTSYGIIANGGRKISSYTIEKIEDKYGKAIFERKEKGKEQILNEQKAFLLTHLMTGMFDERLSDTMHVTGASIKEKLSRVYAGKSGTTPSDSWMIGYSPNLVTGVWVGYDDNREITNVSENAIAKNVWANFMENAHQIIDSTAFTVPKGITWKLIDPETGLLATDDCKTRKLMYFEEGTEPIQTCQVHQHTYEVFDDLQEKETGFFKKLLRLFQ